MRKETKLLITRILFIAIAVLLAISDPELSFSQTNLKLWYKQPAIKWTDALPIGNGRLGAMIFGGVNEDHIQFNEQTLWTGGPRAYAREGASKYLPVIRRLLVEGKQAEAESIAQEHFMGMKSHEYTYTKDSISWFKKMRLDTSASASKFDDSKWKNITQPEANGWETFPGFEGLDGSVWLRNDFDLPANMVGKNLELNLGRVRDIDFTYINGKLVGSTNNTTNRKYIIPAGLLHAGKNSIAIQVLNFYDKGGLTSAKEKPEIHQIDAPQNSIFLNTKWKYWIQNDQPPAYPRYNADYQPFGDIYLQFPNQQVSNYTRDLDLNNAIAHVTYTSGGINYSREYFASATDHVIVIHLTASKPGSITLKATLKTLQKTFRIYKTDNSTLALLLKVNDGVLRGVSYLHVVAIGGKVNVNSNTIAITNANEATFYLTAATNYKNYKDVSGNPDAICKNIMAKLTTKSYTAIKAAHVKDYKSYFDKFSINLGVTANDALPTDERILKFSNTADPALIALYVQYGRYLLISSSRPGGQPANLQGLWNDLLTPPWGSKFTTNINLEMNYWPAEELNLSACSQPFFSMVDDLAQAGEVTAKVHYDAPGWVLHHNTDLWRGTAPVNSSTHGIIIYIPTIRFSCKIMPTRICMVPPSFSSIF